MAKLSRAEAREHLDQMIYLGSGDDAMRRQSRRRLMGAFAQARASKMNVYVPVIINGETVRYEIKGAHLKKASRGGVYANVVHVRPEQD